MKIIGAVLSQNEQSFFSCSPVGHDCACPISLQVTARVSTPPLPKVQSFDGFVDATCLEDPEKKGSLFSKVSKVLQVADPRRWARVP